MTPHQILSVCVRLVALAWAIYLLTNVYSVYAFMGKNAPVPADKVLVWSYTLTQVALCALLWFFPKSVAAKLFPSREGHAPARTADVVEWQTLGIMLLGVWLLTRAVPSVIYWITISSIVSSTGPIFATLNAESKAGMVTTAVELVLGVWLLLGAGGLAALLFRIRTAGGNQ